MSEYWVNVWQSEDGLTRFVEAFADGGSLGRIISDEENERLAAELYLEPFILRVDGWTPPVTLLHLSNGVQYRVIEA